LLSLQRHDVLLVCRDAHAAAIRDDGLSLRSATGDYVAHPEAATALDASHLADGTILLLTVKSWATDAAATKMAAVCDRATPVVCFQNGVGNEELVARHFDTVYGGVCRMTCSALQPGHASFRRLGRLVMGKYPKGSDATVRALAKAFEEAGLDVSVSRNIMADRWLKLAVNTQSVFHAVVDPRDHEANEFFELKARILEETRSILKKARISAKRSDGKDPSIDEMIDELRRPRARRAGGGMNVHNSVWQDLYLRRGSIESPFIHQPLIDLAREHGIPAPYNETALAIALEAHGAGDGPEAWRLAEVLQRIEKAAGA
jgi:2-dehydropantoate 2-reductase